MTGLIEQIANAWSPVRRRSSGGDGVYAGGSKRVSSLFGNNRTDQLNQMASVGTLFSIVDRISSSQAQIEWCLYLNARSGKKEDRIEIDNHLALDLWKKPNDFHTGSMLREMGQQHFELTGETWIVLERNEIFRDIPLGMWTVRPDRLEPVPGETTFLAGYIYTSSDGEKIPLELDEVLSIKRPHPTNPFRGLGAVESIMLELKSARAVAEWNNVFFKNGAMPGGIIEIENELDDKQWRTLMTRWKESHQGVGRAHRVGTLEHGAKFTPVSYSLKDMQMVEVRGMNRDTIMEALGISRHMLGITEDVNRANAMAGEYMYAKYIDLTRAVRWREMLNHFYLPLFNDARPLMFDFHSPVPEDEAADNEALKTKTEAVKNLTDAGYDHDDAAAVCGLPAMRRSTQPGGGNE